MSCNSPMQQYRTLSDVAPYGGGAGLGVPALDLDRVWDKDWFRARLARSWSFEEFRASKYPQDLAGLNRFLREVVVPRVMVYFDRQTAARRALMASSVPVAPAPARLPLRAHGEGPGTAERLSTTGSSKKPSSSPKCAHPQPSDGGRAGGAKNAINSLTNRAPFEDWAGRRVLLGAEV